MTADFTFDSRVEVPSDLLVRQINGESFILNVETELYFGLNESGSRMLEVVSESPTIGIAFEQLRSEFEVDELTLRDDFNQLIGDLLNHGLLKLSGATPV